MQDQVEITGLLRLWREGDDEARDSLFEIAYSNLHSIARGLLRADRVRFALQPTELVNECALRMFGFAEMDWRDRAHFIAMAVTTMRRILIDEARRKKAGKRDGVELRLLTSQLGQELEDTNVEELSEVLDRLAGVSADMARIVELKYFGGLTNSEVAEVLGTSDSTVKRSWRSARAWLYTELQR